MSNLNASANKMDNLSSKTVASTMPKDAHTIIAMLKDMGVTDYEPKVVHQMLELMYSKYEIQYHLFCANWFKKICAK